MTICYTRMFKINTRDTNIEILIKTLYNNIFTTLSNKLNNKTSKTNFNMFCNIVLTLNAFDLKLHYFYTRKK